MKNLEEELENFGMKDIHTLAQTREIFKVSVTTIYKREKQLQKEGNLHQHRVIRPFKN